MSPKRLSDYQIKGVEWMKGIEVRAERRGEKGGGILADDMGMGKTFSMIELANQDRGANQRTLFIVPPNAMKQWMDSIHQQTGVHPLFVDQKTKSKIPKEAKYVVVSSSILNCNVKSSGLALILAVEWKRVIIDEGHIIKAAKSLANETASRIVAGHFWLATGEM